MGDSLLVTVFRTTIETCSWVQFSCEVTQYTDKELQAISDALRQYMVRREYISDREVVLSSFVRHDRRTVKSFLFVSDDDAGGKLPFFNNESLTSRYVGSAMLEANGKCGQVICMKKTSVLSCLEAPAVNTRHLTLYYGRLD